MAKNGAGFDPDIEDVPNEFFVEDLPEEFQAIEDAEEIINEVNDEDSLEEMMRGGN